MRYRKIVKWDLIYPVNNDWFWSSICITYLSPYAPVIVTAAYGVQAHTNRKKIVNAAFATRISALVELVSFTWRDLTFIFFACSLSILSWAWICRNKFVLDYVHFFEREILSYVFKKSSIIANDKHHRDEVGPYENHPYEHFSIVVIAEIIKWTCCQVSLWK